MLAPFKGILSTSLQLKEKDLEFLLPLLPDNKLTFTNLSYLFASSRLIKKVKLKAQDFAVLVELTGLDVSLSPEEMLNFIEIVQDFSKASLSTSEVKFILNHEASDLSERVLGSPKIEAILTKLQEAYQKINKDLQSKFDPDLSGEEQQETLLKVVSALAGLKEEDVQTIIRFLDRNWMSATAAKQFIDDSLDKRIDRMQIDAAIDSLDAASNDISAEQKDLVQALLDAISAFQIADAKRSALEQLLAASFKTGEDLMKVVLNYALLKQTDSGTDLIADLLSDNFDNGIDQATYPKQYEALQLLHKMLYLLHALELTDIETEWYFKHNQDLNWLELDGIPYEAGQTAISLTKYASFLKIISFARKLSPVVNPTDLENPTTFFKAVELLLPAITLTKDELMGTIALLSGYSKEDLSAIDSHLFSAFDKVNYQEIKTWERLLDCAELMRKLSASVTQIIDYIKPTLTASEVSDLRSTLKSRYDEDTWLSTLKEIMDGIRPQKRDALVAYLLATNPGIKGKNDLYEYFLVDVEMESCMPSSRIVLAHNSIQLFVQRCLMGLEPDAIANVESDPNWNQWKWMKNYRVWEANRKVFLYPENWYDVTLTGDKSFLLKEFINELQQNELTNDTAESALRGYMEKLDNIAFLEVMATWYDVPTRNMHVFARTKGGDPFIYYYRRFEKERSWTPWEKVELDITGDHLLAFMRNSRLHLAWPVFSDIPEELDTMEIPNAEPGTEVQGNARKQQKIQLAISELRNKKMAAQKNLPRFCLNTI